MAIVTFLALAGCASGDPDRQREVSDETGMMGEGEADALNALAGRADLAVTASTSDLAEGVVNITASLEILDTPELLHPAITFSLGGGVEAVSVPTECRQTDSMIECELTGLVSMGEPIGTVLQVKVDDGAVDPTVTVVVTSDFNPVSNDPDPSNNTTTIEF